MAQYAMAAGSLVSAYGQYAQGQQNANMANYNADVAAQNAAIAENQGMENARRSLVNSNKNLGSQRALYGAAGVSGGSVLDVLQETTSKAELDAATLQNQGQIKANAYLNEEALDRFRARQSSATGKFNAFASLFGSTAKMMGNSSGSTKTTPPTGGGADATNGASADALDDV